MDDTSEEMRDKVYEFMGKKTPYERLKMGCSMYDFSKQLVTEAILRENPGISKKELRKEVFLRFYGADIDPATCKEILAHLDKQD